MEKNEEIKNLNSAKGSECNYVDARTPEEIANEPESILTTTAVNPEAEKQDIQTKEAVNPTVNPSPILPEPIDKEFDERFPLLGTQNGEPVEPLIKQFLADKLVPILFPTKKVKQNCSRCKEPLIGRTKKVKNPSCSECKKKEMSDRYYERN